MPTFFNLPVHASRRFTTSVRYARQAPSFMIKRLADHHPFLTKVARINTQKGYIIMPWHPYMKGVEDFYILSMNMMMQGKYNERKKRFNNAFQLHESEADYLLRVASITKELGIYLKECRQKGRYIELLHLQEAPNNAAHIQYTMEHCAEYFPSDFTVSCDSTAWGIMTIVNANKLGGMQYLPSAYDGPMHDMNIRKTSFTLPKTETLFTNLHLPHDTPETVLTLIVDGMSQNIINAVLQGHAEYAQFFIGDWNLEPHILEKAICDALSELFPADLDIHFSVDFAISSEGHLKSTQEKTTVDCSICISYYLPPELLPRAQDAVKLKQEGVSVVPKF